MNKPTRSKINGTAAASTAIAAMINILATAGVIPKEYALDLTTLLVVLFNTAIMVWRTYYTDKS